VTAEHHILSVWNITHPSLADYPELVFHAMPKLTGGPKDLLIIARHYLTGPRYDLAFAGDLRTALFFILLNIVFFWRSVPVYVGDAVFLNPRPRNPLKLLYEKAKVWLIRNGTAHLCVLSSSEYKSYQDVWGIPAELMSQIDFKVISEDRLDELPAGDEPFVASGGNSERDYDLLFDAVRGLDIPVMISTTLTFPAGRVPPNVTLCPNNHTVQSFYGPMAKARLVVMPFKDGLLRSTGQGTYLSAMYLGKCLVVTGTPGVHDLVSDGETGLIVPPGDAPALRRALLAAWEDPALRRRVGEKAKATVSLKNRHATYMRKHFDNMRNLVKSP